MRLYMPTKVFFGSGCVLENGAELKALGSRAMIVTGKHSSRINGSLAAVEQALQANGQTTRFFCFLSWVSIDVACRRYT